MPRVIGYSRVPEPPARTIPFIRTCCQRWSNRRPAATKTPGEPSMNGALQLGGGQRSDLAALAVGEPHVAEARLAGEGVDQHGHRVVLLGEVRRVDLGG